MEKRIILAIVLSFLVLILYQAIFVKKPPQSEVRPEEKIQVEKKPEEKILEKETPPPSKVAQEKKVEAEEKSLLQVAAQAEEQILLDTSLYYALWSNRGGILKSWKLKKYKDDKKEDLELVSLHAGEVNKYPFSLETEDPEFNNLINNSLYKSSIAKLKLKDGQKGEIRLEYADGKGTRVEKIFTFLDGNYDFDLEINVWKNGQKIEPRLVWGPSLGNPSVTEQRQRFGGGSGIAILSSGRVYRQSERKFKPEESAFNFVNWAAYEDNYFVTIILANAQKASAVFVREIKEQTPYFFLSVTDPQRIYIGPKEFGHLAKFGSQAKRVINFGFFGWIAEILLRAIKFFHKYIPNWGFAIIFLTLIIKIIFFPLTYSSTKSMARMQELQPKIKALRAKYKKAKQDISQRRQMNEEMMKLYKEHGINPAGGCLPMLIQIPVFWGFFRLLVVGIEFRHSPFILWIKDLSVKDPFYVTPILMGVSQFISQKMTPTSADPAQAKMMLIMPVIMTIFFMNFQSGLVLYWLTSNVLQIGQQYIMNRLMNKKKRETHGKRRKK